MGRILKLQGLAPTIPEDLYHLIKKGVQMHKHMEKNKKDKDSKFPLFLSSPGFTASPGTTAARSSFRRTGSTAPGRLRPWSLREPERGCSLRGELPRNWLKEAEDLKRTRK